MSEEELAKNEFDKDEVMKQIVPLIAEQTQSLGSRAPPEIMKSFPGANSISFEFKNL